MMDQNPIFFGKKWELNTPLDVVDKLFWSPVVFFMLTPLNQPLELHQWSLNIILLLRTTIQ
jgi:hypothetical protein